jgi:hypothetical protein
MFQFLKRFRQRSAANRARSRQQDAFRPEIEALETRRLLSGVHLFGVGGDLQSYEQDLDGNGHATTGWYPTAAADQIISNITVGYDASSLGHLFGVGGDQQSYEQELDGNGHATTFWYPTAAADVIRSNITVGYDASGLGHLFGVGGDLQSYEQDLDGNGHATTGWYATAAADVIRSDITVGYDTSTAPGPRARWDKPRNEQGLGLSMAPLFSQAYAVNAVPENAGTVSLLAPQAVNGLVQPVSSQAVPAVTTVVSPQAKANQEAGLLAALDAVFIDLDSGLMLGTPRKDLALAGLD